MDMEKFPLLAEEWKHLFLINQFGIEEIQTKLRILNEEYEFLHDYNPIEHITSRIKTPKQIVAKLDRMGVERSADNAYRHVHDIGGIRVTCSFSADVYKVAKLLKNQTDIKVVLEKDYIKNPKPNGYRSLHMLVEVPVFLSDSVMPVQIEVQFRSISMDLWASIEHKIYYKSALNLPQELLDRLTGCASRLDDIDREMYEIKQEIKKYMPSCQNGDS